MQRKLFSVLCALAILGLSTSTALAGGNVRLSNVRFALGSLIAKGFLEYTDVTAIKVVLEAVGTAVVTCKDQSGNSVPGTGSPTVGGSGSQSLSFPGPIPNSGTGVFRVQTNNPGVSASKAGCPSGWTAHVDFVYWKKAVITVLDSNTQEVLVRQFYICTTVRNGPNGTRDGSVTCTPA